MPDISMLLLFKTLTYLLIIGFEKIESLIADRTLFEPEESEVRALKS